MLTGGDGYLQALAQADGAARWKAPVEGSITSIYWNTGWVLATTDKNALLAIPGGGRRADLAPRSGRRARKASRRLTAIVSTSR